MACDLFVYAKDDAGNQLPFSVSFEFYTLKNDEWVEWITSPFKIDAGGYKHFRLTETIFYKIVPLPYPGYSTPSEETLEGCGDGSYDLIYSKPSPTISSINWTPKDTFWRVASGASLAGTGTTLHVLSIGGSPLTATLRIDSGASFTVRDGDTFNFDREEWVVHHIIKDYECSQIVLSHTTIEHPRIGEEVGFVASIDWHGKTEQSVKWYYFKAPSNAYTKDDIVWTLFATGNPATHTFDDGDDVDITHLKVIARNTDVESGDFGDGSCADGVFVLVTQAGFQIDVSNADGTDNLYITEMVNIPGTKQWLTLLPHPNGMWANVTNRNYLAVPGGGAGSCPGWDPAPDFCYKGLTKGNHYGIYRGTLAVGLLPESDVHELIEAMTLVTVDSAYVTFLQSTLCAFFEVSDAECPHFILSSVSDVAFLVELIEIITIHKNLAGEDVEPTWVEWGLLPIALFGIASPGISEGHIIKELGKKISGIVDQVKRVPGDFTNYRHGALVDSLIRGTPDDVRAMVDAFKRQDWTTFEAAYARVKTSPIDPLSRLGRLKNWVDDVYKRDYTPKSSADDVAKRSGLLKRYAQTSVDYIRTKAPWMPGQQHGDDVGGVLTDAELPAFRKMMDEITTYFAKKGEYTRYIDPGELAIYFKEHPEFFKQGNTNALMKTTKHLKTAENIEDFIKPLTESEAAVRRAEWHMFIDDLKQGLIDTFGDIRGKQLFEDLGLKAARDAKEINKIIFKWGKRMWDNVYGAARAGGATDEQATALAKIAAESHINIGNGIVSGAYKNQWQTKKGVIGWMQRHPLYTVVLGIGGLGYLTRMIPWYLMDNMPFNIWMGKEAGVIEKSFGDQEGEIVSMITTCGYQLRDFPCNRTVQTNFVELLKLLKELKDIADTTDPVPPGMVSYFKSIYDVVYGVSIGVPNEFMRTRVKIDYSTAYTEYVLRVTEAGCTNPVVPPEGWKGVSGTGSIKCTSDLICLVYLDDLYIGTVYPAGFVIAGVEPGSHKVKMTYSGKPDCVKTVTVVSGRQAEAECLFELPCIPPVPKITAPSKAKVKESVSFKGSATTESAITWWSWDFGDGGHAFLQNSSHKYWNPGTYLVQLTVTDDCGTVTTTHTITIEKEAPPPAEEAATVYVKMPINSQTGKPLVWQDNPEIYVDGQYIRKAPSSISFGGFNEPAVKGCTLMVRATGYDDKSKWFALKDKDSLTWQPYMDPEGYVPIPVPTGCIKTTTASTIVVSIDRTTDVTSYLVKCTGYFHGMGGISTRKYTTTSLEYTITSIDTSRPFEVTLAARVSGIAGEYSSPIGDCTPVTKYPIKFYIPKGARLGEPSKTTTVSRIVAGMRRIGGR